MRGKAKRIILAAVVLLVFTASAGVTGAYLTYTSGRLENVITRGTVAVKVTEPGWIEDNGKGLVPGSVVPKDPAAVNIGKNDAWVFLKVKVPVKTICLVEEKTGRKQAAKKTELLFFEAAKEWELIRQIQEEEHTCFVYGYREPVKPGEKTKELFSEVSLVNYLEGELDETDTLKMPVEAVAIQTDVCAPGSGLEAIYQEYLKQGGEAAMDGKGGAA